MPALDDRCPFCPGNERMLPSIIMETPGQGQGNVDWQVRVVPNKFPALTPGVDQARLKEGIYLSMPGYGRHEVIIESPFHNRDLVIMSREEVETLVEVYHRRYVKLMREKQNMMVVIFRNHGPRAGTSLVHPHSQLIATGLVPGHVRLREREAERYFDETGRCVYCDILEFEGLDRRRVILENRSFLAFVPYAAEVPFEIWIVPRKHRAGFGAVPGDEKIDLAHALQEILAKLHARLDDPDYNYVINSWARYKADEPHLHWYLQVRPRLTTTAGFEIATGIRINPSLPEQDADYLKGR